MRHVDADAETLVKQGVQISILADLVKLGTELAKIVIKFETAWEDPCLSFVELHALLEEMCTKAREFQVRK